MEHLNRHLAPITEHAWEALEAEAHSILSATLGARRLVDVSGPLGWHTSTVDLGRTRSLDEPPEEGVAAVVRRVQPLVETRVPFALPRRELDALARGAKQVDLEPVADAARKSAYAEDRAVFHGYAAAGIVGIAEAAARSAVPIPDDHGRFPDAVAEAVRRLREAGVGGPYSLALGPRCYADVNGATHAGGYPVIEHLRRQIDGALVWAPALNGSVVLSTRGGDFELTVGQDFSIGYLHHDADRVFLYVEETFTFLGVGAEAAIPLTYA